MEEGFFGDFIVNMATDAADGVNFSAILVLALRQLWYEQKVVLQICDFLSKRLIL